MVSAALSDIGRKRAANEDFYALDEAQGIFVVADGLGGHVAGRTASETAVDEFMLRLRAPRPAAGLDALREAVRAANAAILARVGLAGKGRVQAESLSYGERRALEIGVALAAKPRLLFLDEPTAGLGTEGTARIAELIGELKRSITLVMIEHDMKFLFGLADHIYVMHWGQVIAQGTPAELRANPWVQRSNLGQLG